MSVEIRKKALLALKRHAGRDYPHECCGFLVGGAGRRGGQKRIVIEEARPTENLNQERARDRYEIDPRAFQRLQDSLKGTDQEVVGFYHSHPDHPSGPSITDLKRFWEGMIYVIVGVDGKGGGSKRYRVSSWSLEEHNLAVL